jgi:uncharacterized metal-binding protein
MPDARTHDAITVISGAALAPIAFLAQTRAGVTTEAAVTTSGLLVIAHLVSGILFSPDLDLDSAIDDRWGIFFWIWRPYMWLVPHRHRILSHGLVISQLLRLAYFYGVVVGLVWLASWLLGKIGILLPYTHTWITERLLSVARSYPRETWAVLIGFCTGGAAHTIADWCVTGGKRYLRRVGIRIQRDYRGHDEWRSRQGRRARSW